MKKFTLLLSALLIVSLSVLAQIKMIVHLNDADSVEFYASSVDSITFANFSIDSEFPDDADKPTPILPNANGYEYVDLGLPSGTLWATCNVGAATPESYGGLYAWGETKTKSLYTWDTYVHCNGSTSNYISKYTKNDEKTQLERNDDVAYLSRGGDWRMPTYDEFAELRWHCTWKYSVRNNVSGYEVVGQNNNSIFLPFSGYQYEDQLSRGTCGSYWTSTLGNMYEETDYVADRAGALYFDISDKTMEDTFRDAGRAIRPVLKVKYQIVFNANGGEGFMTSMKVEGRRIELPMNTFTRAGYFFIGWNTKADGHGTSYLDQQSVELTENLTLYAQWVISDMRATGQDEGYEYIDLGLPSGTLWATCNVGATTPEGYGDYFAWGETRPKESYTKSNYIYTDSPKCLPLSADAANVNWGGDWHMPTISQIDEILDENNCNWIFTKMNGVVGQLVVSKHNGKSIFLPAAGNIEDDVYYWQGRCACYWSSDNSDSYLDRSYIMNFCESNTGSYDNGLRSNAFSVRPVRPVLSDVEFTFTVMFDGNGGEGTVPAIDGQHDDRVKIPASTFTRDGYYFVGWNTKADGTGTSYKVGEGITQAEDLTLYAQWKLSSGTSYGYTWIDLGLPSGTKWATTNVGASTPEGYGNYYAWGETEPKDYYSWSTYKWCNGSYDNLTKYCTDSNYGKVDNKIVLDLEDDAAHANWGGAWRMPTLEEQQELLNNCTWTWTKVNGVNGYTVTGPNGNSIFLPAAGCRYDSDLDDAGSYGYYWSSSLVTYYGSYRACYLGFFSSDGRSSDGGRYRGQSVRPVLRE